MFYLNVDLNPSGGVKATELKKLFTLYNAMSLKNYSRQGKKSHSLKAMEKTANEVDILSQLRARVPKDFGKHFKALGHRQLLPQRLSNGGDVKISLLMAISLFMGENYLDQYLQKMPDHLRHTTQTKLRDRIITQKDEEILSLQSEVIQWRERLAHTEELLKEALRRG